MFEHPNLHALNRHSSLSVRRGRWLGRRAALLLAVVAGGAIVLASSWHPAQVVAARNSVTILGPKASSLDPVAQWDAGSAEVVSQVFESLTAVDSAQRVQPALAESWVTSADGKTITFHLRSGLVNQNRRAGFAGSRVERAAS